MDRWTLCRGKMCRKYNGPYVLVVEAHSRIAAERERAERAEEAISQIRARLDFDEPWTETWRRIEEIVRSVTPRDEIPG